MSLAIAGMGWITPLGSSLAEVWERLRKGEEAVADSISDPLGEKPYPVFRVPVAVLKDLPIHPRLRRASAISRFAVAAGLAALREGGLQIDAVNAPRIALIFAISNGGVVYTKRFYHDIVATGADAASPLLFPETVFNAPASHLAAILGVAGSCYTLVGDGAVGLLAIRMAEDLMTDQRLEHCLVVGAEEVDWLLCDAYAKWRLVRAQPPIELFHKPAKGMILSEGAGALLISRSGRVRIDRTHAGAFYSQRQQLAPALKRLLRELEAPGVSVIGSANGTFIDGAEAAAVSEALPGALFYSPKPALGESVGASGLWQTIIAATALQSGGFPPLLHADRSTASQIRMSSGKESATKSVVVLSCGLNQQVAGLRLSV
jgi:3-oxoacyl-[acyl-carrier-protein] synthase II